MHDNSHALEIALDEIHYCAERGTTPGRLEYTLLGRISKCGTDNKQEMEIVYNKLMSFKTTTLPTYYDEPILDEKTNLYRWIEKRVEITRNTRLDDTINALAPKIGKPPITQPNAVKKPAPAPAPAPANTKAKKTP